MAKFVLLDELHVEIRAPTDLPEAEIRVVRKVLFSPRFRRQLVERIQEIFTSLAVSSDLRVAVMR